MLGQGTPYAVTLPQGLRVADSQSVDIKSDAGSIGNAIIGTNNTATLTFAQGYAGGTGSITFQAAFDTAQVQPSETLRLQVPNEPAPAVDVTLTDEPAYIEPGEAWLRTDDTPTDVKSIFDALGISPASILSNVTLTYQDPGSDETSNTEATVDAAIDFSTDIHIPKEVTENMREGDTYTITLPPEITVVQGGTYELYGPDGSTSYATAVVGQDGKIVLTFHSAITDIGDAEGNFHFSAKFNKDEINTPGDHVIQIPDEPQDTNVTVTIKSNKDQSIDKKGTPDKIYNASSIVWDVDFNKPEQALNGATLTDTIPDGLTLDPGGVEVFTIGVDVDGNVIAGSETPMDSSAYSVDADGTVHFASPLNKAVRVRYHTTINSDTTGGGDLSFVNNATLTAQDVGSLSTSATVTTKYGRFLDKQNTAYDPTTQTFTWEVRYNYGEQTIDAGDATLTDTLNGEGMVFDEGSFVLRNVTIDEGGRATIGGALDPSEYSITFDGNNVAHISFPQGVHGAIDIVYTTHIEGIVDESGVKYSNDVSTTWGESTHAAGANKPTIQENIVKSLYKVDDVNKQISWLVHVNLSHYEMVNWSMRDVLGEGMTFVNDNLVAIRNTSAPDGGSTLVRDTDYSVSYPDGQTMVITFLGEYAAGTKDSFDVIYYSQYSDDSPDRLTNTATGSWTDTNGGPHSSSSQVTYPRTSTDVDNGQKYGTYNAVTKQITWYVMVNYHQQSYRPATVKDPIAGDQEYVRGSLTIHPAYDSGNMGPAINPGDMGVSVDEPTAGNGQVLTVVFPGGTDQDAGAFWIVFNTSLADKYIDESSTYNNDATFTANDKEHSLHGTVDVFHGGTLLSKEGTQSSDGYVHWSATINASQSTLTDPVLTDTPSANQRIDMSSLVIYRTTVDENGSITTDYSQPLTNGVDYTASYADGGDGTRVLTIHFTSTMTMPYTMEYRASLYMEGLAGVAENHIHLEGSNGEDSHSDDSSSTVSVQVVEGGGTIYGKKGAVTLRKLGADGQVLPGAVLVLQDSKGNRIGPVTVGDDGMVTFDDIVQGTYTLYELSAPEGYTVSPELAAGMAVEVTDATTNGSQVIDVTNAQTEVSLRKVSEGNQPLAGAVFHLEQMGADGSYTMYGTETYTTGADGIIRVLGLPAGSYRFVEDSAPDGYMHNGQTPTFTLTPNDKGVIAPVNVGNFVNYRGHMQLRKVNEDGNPLFGAVFTLSDASGNEVGSYISGSNGLVIIDDLAPGTYTLVETTPPAGYMDGAGTMQITIPDNADSRLTLNLGNIRNSVIVGTILLRKADGDTDTGLSGAVFSVVSAATGEEVAQVTTNAYGMGQVDNLEPGDYTLVEITAPAGYILDTTPHPFTVPEDAQGNVAPIDIGTIDNYQGKMEIQKVSEDGTPLPGAIFTLYDADGNKLGDYMTDANGIATMYQLPPGTYIVEETRSPSGYALVSDPQEITIPDSAQGVVPARHIGPLVNKREVGVAIIHKVDKDTGALLAGATFRLVNTDTGAEIARVTTDSTGNASVSNLAPGHYAFIEVSAPEGYVVDSTPITFEITDAAAYDPIEVTSRDARLPNPPRPTLPPNGPPQTGDIGNGPWIVLMALSAGMLTLAVVLLVKARRRT